MIRIFYFFYIFAVKIFYNYLPHKKTIVSMRKVFGLFLLMIFASFSVFAQKQVVNQAKKTESKNYKDSDDKNYGVSVQKQVVSTKKGYDVIPLGSASNIYTMISAQRNKLFYSPAVDAIVFAHRMGGTISGQTGNFVCFDASLDGGSTWNLTNVVTANVTTSAMCRYPQAAIANPAGNTNPENAYIGVTGPGIVAPSTTWGRTYEATAKLNGTGATNEFRHVTGENEVIGTGMCESNGNLFYMNYNATGNKFFILKGTLNQTSGKVEWAINKTLQPSIIELTDGYYSSGMDIAFGPDGMTGYAVILAALTGHTPTTPKPLIWKTTDGGATWNELPATDNFIALFPWMEGILYPTGQGLYRPFFQSVDLSVDKNNRLHIFTDMASGYSSHPDSLAYTYNGGKSLSRFIVSDGTDWTGNYIAMQWNSDFTWGPSTDEADYNTEIQTSRTADGSKVFYIWNATDTTVNTINDSPDMYCVGYNVGDDSLSSIVNLTADAPSAQGMFYATVAPICKTNGDNFDFEIPCVYTTINISGGPGQPVTFHYLKGMGMDEWAGTSLSTEANILTYKIKLENDPVAGVIDATAKTIAVTLPAGTAVDNLVALFTVSTGATTKVGTAVQASGVSANNFTNPVVYEVTAEDGTTKVNWTVTVTVGKNNEAEILSYSLAETEGTIDATAGTIRVVLPAGTTLTNLVATFSLSTGATAKVRTTVQVSGTTANNFTNLVAYTVTAEDGTTKKTWTVTAVVAAATDFTALALGDVEGVIDITAKTVTAEVPYGTNVTALVTTFTVATGVEVFVRNVKQVSGVTANDFTNPVIYKIVSTATKTTDDTTEWTVTVNVAAASTDATLKSLKYGTTDVPNFAAATLVYNVELPAGTTTVPTVTVEANDANATAVVTPAAALPGETKIEVTAQDGTTKKTYKINFTVAKSNNAFLKAISVQGKALAGFAKETLVYNNVAIDFKKAANIVATAADAKATVKVDTSKLRTADAKVTITVTAEDGKTTKQYVLNRVAPAGINNIAANISIYPNPVSNILTINAMKNTTLIISDVNGKIVYTQKLNTETNQINVSEFTKGIYFVQLRNGNEVVTHRIIVK